MPINRNKTELLTVSLPKDFKKTVVQYAKEEDISVSKLTKDAIEYYVFMNRWGKLQDRLAPAFKKAGIKTDEDVEKYFG